ncbi:HAD family hydrolase, partial [Streptococcus suis]
EAIMEALEATYRAFDFQDWDKEAIHAYILKESVGQLLEKKAGETGTSLAQLKAFFNDEQTKRDDKIKLLPSSKEALAFADKEG